jgi:predicted nucleic acid-binding protein
MERGRVPIEAHQRLRSSLRDSSSGLVVTPLSEEIAETVQEISWSAVPEMPDRIIAATALHLGIPLITRDERLQSAAIETIW